MGNCGPHLSWTETCSSAAKVAHNSGSNILPILWNISRWAVLVAPEVNFDHSSNLWLKPCRCENIFFADASHIWTVPLLSNILHFVKHTSEPCSSWTMQFFFGLAAKMCFWLVQTSLTTTQIVTQTQAGQCNWGKFCSDEHCKHFHFHEFEIRKDLSWSCRLSIPI